PNIERCTAVKLLGVFLSYQLRLDKHVTRVLKSCRSYMYMLRSYKARGLGESKLQIIFNAFIMAKIPYALPALGGFVKAREIGRINSLLRKCKKFGYCKMVYTFEDLLMDSDKK